MPVELDLSDDFQVFDYTTTVTFIRVGLDGTETPFTNVRGLPRALMSVYQGDSVEFNPDRVRWHLDVSTLPPGVPIKRGDKIQDGSTYYILFNDNIETLGTRVSCDTQIEL